MSVLRKLARGLRSLFRKERVEQELSEEISDFTEMAAQEKIKQGMSREDALRAVRLELGTVEIAREEVRSATWESFVENLCRDIRFALRTLRKSPGFSLVVVLTLTLGIGANTAIFTLINAVMLQKLPVRNPEQLYRLGDNNNCCVMVGTQNDGSFVLYSYPLYEYLRDHSPEFEHLAAFESYLADVSVRGPHDAAPEPYKGELVTGNYFQMLGVNAVAGRLLAPSDDTKTAAPVAVMSYRTWKQRFALDPAVVGSTLVINGVSYTVAGVTAPQFYGDTLRSDPPDFWLPLLDEQEKWRLESAASEWLYVIGRLKPGFAPESTQQHLTAELQQWLAAHRDVIPDRDQGDIPLQHIHLTRAARGVDQMQTDYAVGLRLLATLSACLLLIACANIANLMLARGAQRQREMSVRLALGAGRARILRQMLVESLLLAAFGGAGGLLAGYFGRTVLPKMTENAWERSDFRIQFDWRVFAFTAGITILTGLLFGLAPAVAASRAEVTHGLKETSQTTTRRRKGMGGKALVGFQIALSTLLVIGAGLFLRTLAGLSTVNVGFRTENLLLAELSPPEKRYPAGKDIALHQQLERAIAAIPGVDSVAPAMEAYVSDDLSGTNFLPEGEAYDPNKHQEEDYNVVGTQFFQTLGIPVVAGRAFGEQDTASSLKVGIINESMARTRFPGQSPLGKRFVTDRHDSDGHGSVLATDAIQIVGICADTRYMNLRAEPPPQFYLPYVQQSEIGGMVYEIHTRMKPDAILPALRHVVQQVDPDLPLVNVRTQEQQIAADLIEERVFVTLTSGFGLLALALACVGIYGIMAYSVANRRNEIGIRMALGAQPGQVRGMILRESTWLAGAGILAGMAAALPLTRLVRSMLYGVQPWDPGTMAGGVLILLAVALAASWIPARRAARVQPMDALLHE